MKIVIAGGTGHLGAALVRHFNQQGHQVVVLSRSGAAEGPHIHWDGRTLGPWAQHIDGSDAVINLAGRTVNCRYTEENLRQMLTSRVDSTAAVGEAILRARKPPRVWLQMSTATLYAHRFDAANDEHTGQIGGAEPDAPAYWGRSIEIAQAWEDAQNRAVTPSTRKVALRTAMVMSTAHKSVFDVLLGLVRARLGGPVAGGRQYVSWIHEEDFLRAIDFLISAEGLAGPVNLCAPHPLPQRDFMSALREAWGARVGLPATRWMVEVGAFVLRTDTELLLKSRRVVPARLLEAGFRFHHPDWPGAARDLVSRWRNRPSAQRAA